MFGNRSIRIPAREALHFELVRFQQLDRSQTKLQFLFEYILPILLLYARQLAVLLAVFEKKHDLLAVGFFIDKLINFENQFLELILGLLFFSGVHYLSLLGEVLLELLVTRQYHEILEVAGSVVEQFFELHVGLHHQFVHAVAFYVQFIFGGCYVSFGGKLRAIFISPLFMAHLNLSLGIELQGSRLVVFANVVLVEQIYLELCHLTQSAWKRLDFYLLLIFWEVIILLDNQLAFVIILVTSERLY